MKGPLSSFPADPLQIREGSSGATLVLSNHVGITCSPFFQSAVLISTHDFHLLCLQFFPVCHSRRQDASESLAGSTKLGSTIPKSQHGCSNPPFPAWHSILISLTFPALVLVKSNQYFKNYFISVLILFKMWFSYAIIGYFQSKILQIQTMTLYPFRTNPDIFFWGLFIPHLHLNQRSAELLSPFRQYCLTICFKKDISCIFLAENIYLFCYH